MTDGTLVMTENVPNVLRDVRNAMLMNVLLASITSIYKTELALTHVSPNSPMLTIFVFHALITSVTLVYQRSQINVLTVAHSLTIN
jgi:hypothetical protein